MIALLSLVFIVVISIVFTEDEACYWPKDVQAEKIAESCADIFSPGLEITGVFSFEVGKAKFDAFCLSDPVDGPAWTIIQRRIDGSVDFFRNWQDYENGFGEKTGEYWLGLKNIYELTNADVYELWILLVNYDGEYRFARYDSFKIADANQQYALSVGKYGGDAGDSFGTHNGDKFYTKDKDSPRFCSKSYVGAWWFHVCYESHLNSVHRKYTAKGVAGMKWETFGGDGSALRYTHMAVRPAKYA